MRILIIVLSLLFSTLAFANTYLIKGDKVKDKNGTEYLIFKDENKIQLGFKVDGLNLIPINKSKIDSVKKDKQDVEANTEEKNMTLESVLNQFSINMLKLSMTFLGIFFTFIAVGLLGMLLYFIVALSLFFKKR